MEKKPKPLPDFKKSGKWGGPQMLILICMSPPASSSPFPHRKVTRTFIFLHVLPVHQLLANSLFSFQYILTTFHQAPLRTSEQTLFNPSMHFWYACCRNLSKQKSPPAPHALISQLNAKLKHITHVSLLQNSTMVFSVSFSLSIPTEYYPNSYNLSPGLQCSAVKYIQRLSFIFPL